MFYLLLLVPLPRYTHARYTAATHLSCYAVCSYLAVPHLPLPTFAVGLEPCTHYFGRHRYNLDALPLLTYLHETRTPLHHYLGKNTCSTARLRSTTSPTAVTSRAPASTFGVY